MIPCSQNSPRVHILAGIFAGCFLLFGIPARADTVTLDNGKTLEGRVTVDATTVTIELAQGTIKISKSRVVSIEPKETLPDEYANRSSQIRARTASDHLDDTAQAELWYQLANWAGEKRLSMARTESLKKTIELNPNHAAARQASGFVFHEDRWMSTAERNQSLGMVLLDGKWVPKEAQDDVQRLKDERAQKDRDDDTDRRIKEAELQKLEAEKRLIDAQRERLAVEQPRQRYGYSTPFVTGYDIPVIYGPTTILAPVVPRYPVPYFPPAPSVIKPGVVPILQPQKPVLDPAKPVLPILQPMRPVIDPAKPVNPILQPMKPTPDPVRPGPMLQPNPPAWNKSNLQVTQ